MKDAYTDEFVADSGAFIDAVVTDDQTVNEGENWRQIAGHSRIISQLVYQETEPISVTLGDLHNKTTSFAVYTLLLA